MIQKPAPISPPLPVVTLADIERLLAPLPPGSVLLFNVAEWAETEMPDGSIMPSAAEGYLCRVLTPNETKDGVTELAIAAAVSAHDALAIVCKQVRS